jgi:hypothetical protein
VDTEHAAEPDGAEAPGEHDTRNRTERSVT